MFTFWKREKAKGKGRRSAASSGYLRSQTPVNVRPSLRAWGRRALRWGIITAAVLLVWVTAMRSLAEAARSDERFTLSAQGLHVTGVERQDIEDIREVFASDLDGSLVDTRIDERHRQLLAMPWVRQASLLRMWPNRLWVHVVEREPVAFVRVGKHGAESMRLIDREGILLNPPRQAVFSLPVVTGIEESMPLEERQRRVNLFERMLADLDSNEPAYGEMVSEIDVSDARNAHLITVHQGDVIELQMGEEQFRHRFAVYLKYIDSWKREFARVQSIDLRFEGHVAIR